MAVITLTFTGSEEEITDGIPRYMTIESNAPSTIYYTTDGSIPSLDSTIYTEIFSMPEGRGTVVLSAFGVGSDGYAGSVLTQTFAADTTDITVARLVDLEGFILDRYSDQTNTVWGYDADGDDTSYYDVDTDDLDYTKSATGLYGLGDGTQIEVGIPDPADTAYPFDDNFQAISTNEKANMFNPYAKTVVIDNRNNPEVSILNRPWGSIRNMSRGDTWSSDELGSSDSTYISGGFVRRFYDSKNNIMVSYYMDHNTNRYVKGIQDLPSNIQNVAGFHTVQFPLVFRWLSGGRHSSIL